MDRIDVARPGHWAGLCAASLLLVVSLSPVAHAQVSATNSRFSVGFAAGQLFTLDSDASDSAAFSPLFRFGNSSGFGPAFGMGWFKTELPAGIPGFEGAFADVHVRPIMGGLEYTLRRGPWAYDLGVTVGYTFNTGHLLPEGQRYFGSLGLTDVEVDVANSAAVRPRVRVYYDTPSRITLVGGAGVTFVDADVTLRSGAQSLRINRNLSSFSVEAGIMFALF
jgi:opacity protein-like surface antigen